MDNGKKIVVVLSGITTLLTIGIFSEVKYSNRVQAKENDNIGTREIIIKKKSDNKDINNIKDDIDEDLINDETNKEIIEEIIKEETSKNQKSVVESKKTEEKAEYNVQVPEKIEFKIVESTQAEVSTSTQTYISEIDKIKQYNEYLGTAGRLYIPSVNINVGLNYANIYDDDGYNAQDIVDRYDSAAYYSFANKITIADHNYQGFSNISNLNLYSNAYIKRNSTSVEEYQLINKFSGHNIGTDIIDNYGNSIENMQGQLVMYTCYGTGDGVMVTLWNKLN